jgi:hypothetical protein
MATREQIRASCEHELWAAVTRLGATRLPGTVYVNSSTPVHLVCRNGHTCAPTPGNIRKGQGICRACAGRDPLARREEFWAAVADQGAVPAAGAEYVDGHAPVPLVCARGHSCSPRPYDVLDGHAACRTCATRDPAAAAEIFWALVTAAGGLPRPGAVYVNRSTPVPIICRRGHLARPRPSNVRKGQGLCGTCAALARKRSRRLNGTLSGPTG